MSDPFVLRLNPALTGHPGLLSGLTLAVKDLFDVAGVATLCGVRSWPDPEPKARHAALVDRLLDLGLTLVGKTVTEQIAHSTIGINPDYGTPTNGRDPKRVPGGSSSGSASAVALGLVDVGLGSDTGGSVRIPAAYQGLWGMRPTTGSLPLDGAMALAPSFDTAGFFTRDLATLARVHRALTPGIGRLLDLCLPLRVWATVGLASPWAARAIDLPWDQGRADRLSLAFRTQQALEVTARHGALAEDRRLNLHPEIRARLRWNKGVTQGQRDAAAAAAANDLADLRAALGDGQALLWPTIAAPAPLIAEVANLPADYRARQFGLTAPAGLLGAPQLHVPVGELGFSLLAAPGADLDLLTTAEALSRLPSRPSQPR